jgi:hypothetical protein
MKTLNLLKAESIHALTAVQRELPADRPDKGNFAEEIAGDMAGVMIKNNETESGPIDSVFLF